MSNQLQITGGGKVRNLEGVITGTSGVLSSVPLGAANGVATLDSGGKVPVSQLPSSVVTYLGTWNAATNTPTLVNGTGDAGDMYICNVAGTVNFGAGPVVFVVGDWVLYGSGTWQKSSGQNGTVTSVGLSTNAGAITIGNSPISTSGTITANFNGTNLQYVNGAGNLTTFPTLTGYVPYSGATANVNLGEYGLSGGFIGFDTTPTSTPTAQGTMYWSADKESVDVIMNGVTGSVMQDTFYNVKNQTGATITKGTIVRANGTVGASGRILIAPFLADGTYDSKVCLGVTAETILNGEDGKVTAFGAIRQIDTSAFANGTILYASPTTAGGFTSTEPTNPSNIVTIAIVVYSDVNNGEIFVRPTFVDNAADIAAALGYTPANDALVVHLAGTETITGAKTFSGLTSFTNTSGINLQYGAYINKGNTPLAFSSGNTNIYSDATTNNIVIRDNLSIAKLEFNNSTQTYTFPNATGTIALTTDLGAYLPLAGGTLTGALGGTTATFNGLVTINNNFKSLILNRSAVGNYNGIGLQTATVDKWFIGMRENLSSNNLIIFNDTTAHDVLTISTTDAATFYSSVTATSFVKTSGTSSQFLKADGSVDSSTYLTTSAASSTYLPLSGGTLTGALNINLSSGTAMNVAGNAIFRGDTGVGTPRQLIITSGGSTPVYLEAKGYGANYQTDFGIRTYNNVGTAFEVFYADSSGRVGINQVSPSYQLDVNGNTRISGVLTLSSTISNGTYSYTLPSATGTLALTSAIPANPVGGTGTTNYLPKFTGTSTIGNSLISDDGTNIQASRIAGDLEFGIISGSSSVAGNSSIALYSNTGSGSLLPYGTIKVSPDAAGNTRAAKMVFGVRQSGGALLDALTIASTGNVGIGTINPGSKLDVYSTTADVTNNPGNSQIRASASSTKWLSIGYDGPNNVAYLQGAENAVSWRPIVLNLNGTTTSPVLIGQATSDGVSKLQVTGAATFSSSVTGTAFLTNAASGAGGQEGLRINNDNGYIGFFNSANTTRSGYLQGNTTDVTLTTSLSTPLIFGTANVERMRITSGGQVLIGATSHEGVNTNALQIKGSTAQFLINNTAGTTNHFTIYSASDGNIYNVFGTTGQLLFGTGAKDTSGWSEKMRLLNNGNLLIGTTTDEGYKLYVNGGSSNGMLFYSTSAANQIKAAGTAPAITFSNTITSPTIGGSLGACTSANQFLSGTAAGDMILINQFTGNKLYITNYSGGVYLTQGATSWTANSDIRLKNINSHIENAVEKLSTLQTINFSYKDDKTNKQNLGLIAQEVEKIFPELIDKNGDGMLGVRYTELVPVLIKAVQELKLEIETLKNK